MSSKAMQMFVIFDVWLPMKTESYIPHISSLCRAFNLFFYLSKETWQASFLLCLLQTCMYSKKPHTPSVTLTHTHTHTHTYRHTQMHMLTLRLPGCLGGELFSGRQYHMLSSLPRRAEPTAALLS